MNVWFDNLGSRGFGRKLAIFNKGKNIKEK